MKRNVTALILILAMILLCACAPAVKTDPKETGTEPVSGANTTEKPTQDIRQDSGQDGSSTSETMTVDSERAKEIAEALAAYHAEQLTGTAASDQLLFSDTVAAELEERRVCIGQMAERIGARFVSSKLAGVDIESTEETEDGFIIRFSETIEAYYSYSGSSPDNLMAFGSNHCALIAFDGTVVSDVFSEEYSTGFNNTAELQDS